MMMEDRNQFAQPTAFSSSAEQFPAAEPSPRLRPRTSLPEDVPEDVDFLMEHLNDPNYDIRKKPTSVRTHSTRYDDKKYSPSEIDTESDRYSTSRAESRNSTAIDFDDESPYPEVRASVASIDDPSMPVNTFRMWFLGFFFCILVSGLNMIFSMRYPSVYITGIIAQLLSLPMGKLLERILPTTVFTIPLPYFGRKSFSFNPGPFNVKEHVCITVMANLSINSAYATDVVATQKIFYGQNPSYSYQALICIGTQVLGFSLGGLLRQFTVWPSSMIWPGTLVNCALFNTLHQNYSKSDSGHMSRMKFFLIVFVCSFVYYWVPGYLFVALSYFNWPCWIAPENPTVNALFGTASGLGMGILTLDWSMISFISSPMVTPFWSQMNTGASLLLNYFMIVPIFYFTNKFFTAYLPISTYIAFNNIGMPYDPSAIVTNGVFDVEKYRAYSPVFVTATMLMAYCISFGAFAAIFVHTFLWFRRDITRRFRSSLKDERDIHSRLMQVYTEVPSWWYLAVGIISFAFIVIAIEIFPTQLPVWAAAIAFGLAAVLCIPLAMLMAITNQTVPLQVPHEMFIGYMLPGRPVANIIFKTIAYVGGSQAVTFAGNLKLGHYMKVPPRTMFMVQLVAAITASLVGISVQEWMYANVQDICTPQQASGFVCPSTKTFATASLLWGAIGPQRLFGAGQPYNALLWYFLIGAILPIPFYFLSKRYPLSWFRYVNIPVFFAGVGAMPPASGINYASWVLVGFIFNFIVRRTHFRWWMRYNYILSAGLDAGVAIAMVVIFFAVTYPTNGKAPVWWGNTIFQNTFDWNAMPLKLVAEGEIFGPTSWS